MKEKSRTELEVVSCGSCSTDEIRCLGTGRIYIRLIQADITLGEKEDFGDQSENCLLCGREVLLTEMRRHAESSCANDIHVSNHFYMINCIFLSYASVTPFCHCV
jgi:hypothetical protein